MRILDLNTSSHHLEHDLFLRNVDAQGRVILDIPALLVDKVERGLWHPKVVTIVERTRDELVIVGERVRPSNGLETVYYEWLVRVTNVVFYQKIFGYFGVFFRESGNLVLNVGLFFETTNVAHDTFFDLSLIKSKIIGVF